MKLVLELYSKQIIKKTTHKLKIEKNAKLILASVHELLWNIT